MARRPRANSDLLLRRFRAGDEAAFAAIFDGWSGSVFRLAARILQNDADAEEVVEETFWQAWRNREQFDAGRGSLTAWLLAIARSRALDRRRAGARRPEMSAEGPELDRIPVESPGDPAELQETAARVQTALGELGREQREVIEAAYFGGLTQTEIAERLAIPLGTVKTRIRLGLARLSDALQVLGSDA